MVKKTKNSTFYHTILSLPVLRKIKCPKRRIVGHYRHIEKKIHSKNAQKQRFCLTEFRDCDYMAFDRKQTPELHQREHRVERSTTPITLHPE